jgi:hypothetical protein
VGERPYTAGYSADVRLPQARAGMLRKWSALASCENTLRILIALRLTVAGAPYYYNAPPRRFELANTLQKVLAATDAADPDSWIGYIYDGADAPTAPSWIGVCA